MNQLFVGIIVVMGLAGWFLWTENTNLKAENMAYELKHAAPEEAIEQLQNDFELQGNALMNIQSKSQEIQNEMNRYLDIFKRHNLSKLAAAKPGLIEPKANKATKEVFRGIEEDSRHIDDLDDNVVELQTLP